MFAACSPTAPLRVRLRRICTSLLPAILVSFALPLLAATSAPASTTVVISQVYTAGGNSGSTFNADYVELFNLSSAPVSITGWALQYFSATASATSSPTITKLTATVTLQPGQHYLVEATPGSVGTATANTPDLPNTNLAMGAAAGRIYVTTTQTALSNAAGCPTAYVDFVGYGTTANCFEGSAPAPAPSLSQPIARTNSCVDTNSNNTEFALTSTAARNTSSPLSPCTGSGAAILSGATFNPASANAGTSTLLTATGTTGLTVTANLGTLGGSTTQPLYDDGTNGDAIANDGTYSVTVPVLSTTASGSYNVVVTGKNSAMSTGTASATLTVTQPVAFVAIHSIQGNTPGTSPCSGQTVMTHGIVTSILSNGYVIQARDSEADTDPHTPEGIVVYTGSGKVPATATIGSEVQVTGTATLYPSAALIPGLELSNTNSFSVLTTGNPLPTAITLSTSDPSPSGGILQLPYLQGMRVAVPNLTVTQPTDGTLTETNETYVSNGQFWGEVTGLPRPTREPGLDVRDPLTASQASTIARFDSDPETFLVDSLAAGNTNVLNVATGATMTGVSGVVDLTDYAGLPAIVLDVANRPTVSSNGITAVAVPASSTQTTIGDQNMERFYDNIADGDGAVTVTAAAYQLRLSKASLGVRNILRTPDILAVEEMENTKTMTDLSAQISSDAKAAGQADPQYATYLVSGNDPSGINVGFFINPNKINVTDVTQFGKTTTYTTPAGTQYILNDRPPLVLHAGIKRSGAADYPVTVIVNHLRSLNGITDPSTGPTVRAKREAQAEYLANLIQGYQAKGEHVIVVGEFNAFDVNDGLVDSLGVIKGNPAPASQDVVAGASGLVNPVLVDAAPTNVPNGAYSYVFDGYAQSIDHFLATQDIAGSITTQPAHWNADFPVIFRNDPTRPEASSDHDGIIGYLTVPSGMPSVTFASTITKQTDGSYVETITITNSGSGTATAAQVAAASLGAATTSTALPVSYGDIAAGSSVSRSFTFPASAGTSGSRVVQKFSGTYSNSTFGYNLRTTLP